MIIIIFLKIYLNHYFWTEQHEIKIQRQDNVWRSTASVHMYMLLLFNNKLKVSEVSNIHWMFQGIGIALILSQALLGIYSIVGVSWMFIYFRDSFITKQDTYRWSVPYDGFQGKTLITVIKSYS